MLEQFCPIKKSIQDIIKDPNHEATNSSYITTLMEHIEHRKFKKNKEENKTKKSNIQSLSNQYSYTYNDDNNCININNNDDDNNNNNSKISSNSKSFFSKITVLMCSYR